MYTLLIVDDEKKIRTGLTQIVNWQELGYELVGSVADGGEALAYIEQIGCPDVIMTDIRMPVVDGIRLIEQVKERGYGASFMILSGFEYFQYAKRAIELGVFDYILKPTKLPELQDKFAKLRAKLDEAARTKGLLDQSASLMREQALQALVAGNDRSEEQLAGLLRDIGLDGAAPDSPCIVAAVRCKEAGAPRLRQLLAAGGGAAGAEAVRRLGYIDPLGNLVLVYIDLGHGTEDALEAYAAAAVRQQLDELRRGGMKPGAGLGSAVRGPERLPQSHKQALAALQTVLFQGDGALVRYAEPEPAGEQPKYPHELEKQLLAAIEAGDTRAAAKLVDRLFAASFAAPHLQPAQVYAICIEMLVVMARQYNAVHRDLLDIFDETRLGYLKIADFATLEQLKAWFKARIELMIDFVLDSRDSSNSRIVSHIKKLIASKYHEQLTLHDIADSLFMNPDYLSRLFKKTTGQSFIDYLTHYRIDQAKLFLQDVTCKSYEVGFRVGYQNPSYFAKTFKKVTGRSVSEYREDHT